MLLSGKAKEAGLDTPGTEGLTEEEKRVLKLLVVGRNGKEIAAGFHVPQRGQVMPLPTTLATHNATPIVRTNPNATVKTPSNVRQL